MAAVAGWFSAASCGAGDDPGTASLTMAEVEPNDGPTAAGAQSLGALSGSRTVVVTGQLASGGFDGARYTGDWDLFAIDLAAAGTLDVTVDWAASADVDVAVYDASQVLLGGDGSQAKPAVVRLLSASGKLLVALFSKNQPTSYTLTVAYVQAPPGSTGGSCPTTPILAANHTGGCNIDVVNPVCELADLTNGRSYELDWTTHQTMCEGPHRIQVSGDPPSDANSVYFSIASTYSGNDASMVRNIGGYMKLTAQDIAPLTSATGIYYWGVSSFYGSHSEARAFRLVK